MVTVPLPGKIALGGNQRPGPVQDAVVARTGRERKEKRHHAGTDNLFHGMYRCPPFN